MAIKILKYGLFLVLALIFAGCNVAPQAIDYGHESCYFCKMTIVDKVHAAELVTQKGKVYKFDATECMIHFMKDFNVAEIELYLSNNFTEPEVLIDATEATFLISKQIPSPMGAFLSAFKYRSDAEKIQQENGGRLYNWNELLLHLSE
ncbi:nitrous oxide reductase accessory protein NosL [Aestuariivivens sediminis]|uniref:nitrous oxide reductase accessory protein NosL n=1 Tax=Aestuariivivens sediminis TaxID=2913557 RepID=UPI001F59BD82|nr:nitrous oxide reductase accessory protein NosL [Aestuariivivens sediminis]